MYLSAMHFQFSAKLFGNIHNFMSAFINGCTVHKYTGTNAHTHIYTAGGLLEGAKNSEYFYFTNVIA